MCNKCNKKHSDCNCNKIIYDPCKENQGCLENIDADCVIYNANNINGNSGLPNLGIPNGSNLKSILEKIDTKLSGASQAFSSITTLKTVSNNNDLQISELSNSIIEIKLSILGLLDSLSLINQNTFQSQIDNLLNIVNDIEIKITSLSNNEIPLSSYSGNQIKLLSDGYYVEPFSQTSETAIGVKDSGRSVKLYASGTSNHTLEADVKLDESTINPLRKMSNGGINIDVEKILDIMLSSNSNSSIRTKFKQLL
jgi:hypothetical protein